MIFDKLFSPQASGTANPAKWLVDWTHGGAESDSGIFVDSESAYKSGPYFQAVATIAGDVGMMPLRVMQRQANGDTERDRAHPAHALFQRQANNEMCPMTFMELLQTWALTWGNGVAAIIREGSRPTELVPLLPDRTGIERATDNQLWYWTRIEGRGEKVMLRPENVVHIKGLSANGLWGRSIISLAGNSIGMDQALVKHGGLVFKNGAVPGGLIQRSLDAKGMTPDAQKNLSSEWNRLYGGLDNSRKVAILQEGMTFQPLSISNIDAQWLQAMAAAPEQIARWFLLPPHKLGVLKDSSVRANIEQQNRNYLDETLMRWLVKWEQETSAKLLTDRQRRSESHFFKFNTAALLRADTKTRYETYQLGRVMGVLSPNEIRLREDMNRRTDEGGESYDNPNTSSPSPTPEPAEAAAEPPASGEKNSNAAHRALVADRAAQMILVECQKVKRAAKRGGNFLSWIDAFYDSYSDLSGDYLMPSLGAAIAAGIDVGIASEVIGSHADTSRSQLVELAGVCTADTLAAEVEKLVESWHTRAESLVNKLLPAGPEGVKHEAA